MRTNVLRRPFAIENIGFDQIAQSAAVNAKDCQFFPEASPSLLLFYGPARRTPRRLLHGAARSASSIVGLAMGSQCEPFLRKTRPPRFDSFKNSRSRP